MEYKNIAVIGLGAMGSTLATLLLRAGYAVAGFDVVPEQIAKLTSLGLRPSKSPAEAAENADLVLLSLMNWDVVSSAVEGKGGVLKSAKQGLVILDTSTVSPVKTAEMAAALSERGIRWLDLPISGAANQVAAGDAVFMGGGDREVFESVRPLLEQIGKKAVYVGKNGQASLLKLIVNLTLFLNQASAIESFSLGLKAGLDPEVMFDVISSGAAASNLIDMRGRDMLHGEFKAKGPLKNNVKDMDLILDAARDMQVVLPLAALYQQLQLKASYEGWGFCDATVVMKVYEKMAETGAGKVI